MSWKAYGSSSWTLRDGILPSTILPEQAVVVVTHRLHAPAPDSGPPPRGCIHGHHAPHDAVETRPTPPSRPACRARTAAETAAIVTRYSRPAHSTLRMRQRKWLACQVPAASSRFTRSMTSAISSSTGRVVPGHQRADRHDQVQDVTQPIGARASLSRRGSFASIPSLVGQPPEGASRSRACILRGPSPRVRWCLRGASSASTVGGRVVMASASPGGGTRGRPPRPPGADGRGPRPSARRAAVGRGPWPPSPPRWPPRHLLQDRVRPRCSSRAT